MIHSDTPPLKRTFQSIPEDKLTDADQTSFLREMGWRNGSTWEDLLKSPRVLIISEAGAGKTYECRERQKAMWEAGDPAFYLELADLARSTVRDMFSAEEEARFDAWLSSQSDVATFFLDSVDELKLTLGSFELALKRLAKAVAGQLSRIRVVVTSRPIPIDQQLIRQTLPLPAKPDTAATSEEFADVAMGKVRQSGSTESEAKPWRNVALMPLSDEQMKQMAVHERVTDPEALIAEIRRRNAEEFARRPQDLIELCADWRDHKRIRTHREQVDSNVAVKLKPRTDRAELVALSFDRAREGASRLALAAILTRKLTLRHSAEADRDGAADQKPLDPAAILPDWTADERATLLERPLFGFASYGRVRFHHRSVLEYLAAQRIIALRAKGMPLNAIRRLLFATTAQGSGVVRPSMAPIAAWVSLEDNDVFAGVLEREPSVLLNHGDPESLTPDQRKQALRAYVGRYGGGGWRGMNVPGIQILRLAGKDLGPEIGALWKAGIENLEVRSLLLDLIGTGGNTDCADLAHAAATDTTLSENERLDGLQALIGLADPRLDAITASIADDAAAWPERLTRHAIVRLFPDNLSVDRLCKILARVKEKRRSVGDISYNLPRIIERGKLSDDQLEALRDGLTTLASDGLSWQENAWPRTTSNRLFLMPALGATCVRLFERGIATEKVLRSAIIAVRLADREYDSSEGIKALRSIFAGADSDLRKALFLADDAFLQGLKPQPDAFRRYARISFHDGTILPDEARDAGWIIELLSDRTRPAEERAMILEPAMRLRPDGVTWVDHLASLKPHVADIPELVAVLDEKAKPAERDLELERMEREHAEHQRKSDRRDAKAHASWIAFWKEIAAKPDVVFADDRSENTAWNLWRAMERTGEDSRASGWNRRFIERNFGKDVADRLRFAVMKFWRRDRPTLRSERSDDEKGTYLTRWQLGLAGISAESEDPAWASKLTPEEAALAVRYAPLELNGFPAWLGDLAVAHGNIVETILGGELDAELRESPTQHSSMLQNIRNATPALSAIFVPRLRAWLDAGAWRAGTPDEQAAQRERLTQVLSVLLQQDDAELAAHIRGLAADELAKHADGPLAHVWLPILLRLDSAAGVSALEKMLTPLAPAKFGTAINWFSALFGDRQSIANVPLTASVFSPELLLRLIRLAYQHVRPIDDMERREGVYTPNERDDAERARNHILSALLAAEGPKAWAAKLQMTDDPLFAHFKDRIATVARERSADEADAATFAEADIAALDKYGELAPLVRDEMFSLMNDRLDDLNDLLLRDDSPRAAWALINDETTMRQQIARELRTSANGSYTVNQEAVTADGKETDIRMRSVLADQEAVIELKIGEKDRSGAELRAGIKDQLVTKYMAPDARRSGCFLVTINSDRSWEHPDTKEKLDLAGLVNMLNEEAAKIEQQLGGTVRLVARGLDLRARLKTEVAIKKANSAAKQ